GRSHCRSRLARGRRVPASNRLHTVGKTKAPPKMRGMVRAGGEAASISVVVPVYNGAQSLDALAERVGATLEGVDCELVLVNDGSPDDSWKAIEELVARDPRIRGLNLMRNYGQHNATLAGIRAARNEIIVTIDDDLQHPPEEIPKVVAALGDEYDVAYG